jgi:hypothetical protein
MQFHFLVEEPSAVEVLQLLIPKLAGQRLDYQFHRFMGKRDLLSKLENRLNGLTKGIPSNKRFVILVDRDRDDCHVLKRQLIDLVTGIGLQPKVGATANRGYNVLCRIAVEEIEAWFLGDPDAIRKAYPKVNRTFENQAAYRDPDQIKGGTWEALERLLQKAGYHLGGLAKIQAARDIAPHMDPNRNRSRSFHVFRDGIKGMIQP